MSFIGGGYTAKPLAPYIPFPTAEPEPATEPQPAPAPEPAPQGDPK